MNDLIHLINTYTVSVYYALIIALSALNVKVHLFTQQICEIGSILTHGFTNEESEKHTD